MSTQITALKQKNREEPELTRIPSVASFMDKKLSYGHDNGGIIKKLLLKGKNPPLKKNYHLTLKGDDIGRLERLQEKIGSGTQADVFSAGLSLLELIVKEHEMGSVFYIKRGSNNIEQYDLFESS
jgi:hypothetical protein